MYSGNYSGGDYTSIFFLQVIAVIPYGERKPEVAYQLLEDRVASWQPRGLATGEVSIIVLPRDTRLHVNTTQVITAFACWLTEKHNPQLYVFRHMIILVHVA